MHQTTLDLHAIAAELGISQAAVRARIRRQGSPYKVGKDGPKKSSHLSHDVATLATIVRERRCLSCRDMFRSIGSGNRRCTTCSGKMGHISPADSTWLYVC